MSLLRDEVGNIFGGVSQQPQTQRSSSHLDGQVNAHVYQGRLLGRRPPTFHIANIDDSVSGEATTFDVVRSASEKYKVVILNDELKVYNGFTGTEMTVEAPDGFGYLADAIEGYRQVTIGDRTVLVNRSKNVLRGTTTSPDATEETLIVIRQGNFGTGYAIALNNTYVNYLAPRSNTANAEEGIATEAITIQLFNALEAETDFDGVFVFSRFGSTILVSPVTPGQPYTVLTSDGLGNEGMSVLKSSVQRFEDLPTQAPDGFILEVRGDESTAFDSFWVSYDDARSTWQEVVTPGCLLNFDKSTMPHLLEYKGRFLTETEHTGAGSNTNFTNSGLSLSVNSLLGRLCRNITDGSQGTVLSNTGTTVVTTPLAGGGRNTFLKGDLVEVVGYGTYFIFRQAPWEDRAAGDTQTNPYPSFIGKPVRDAFVTQGRMGLIADESVVLSRTKYLFDLFHASVTQVLPDAPIDITETLPSSSKFHAATMWKKRIVVWTDLAQYELGGEPVLTAETVFLKQMSSFPSSPRVRPVSSGDRIFFIGVANGLIRVMALKVLGDDTEPTAISMTDEIPSYIEGVPLHMDSDDTNGILLLLTRDGGANNLYAMSYVQEEGQIVQHAWGQWFLATPLAEQVP